MNYCRNWVGIGLWMWRMRQNNTFLSFFAGGVILVFETVGGSNLYTAG